MKKLLFFLLSCCAANAQTFSIRINVGASANYTDSAGKVWLADELYNAGNTYTTTDAISNTTDQAIYQSERYNSNGPFGYSIGVPNGTHTVTLKFSENYYTSAGSRAFSVYINNVQVLYNYDVYSASGGKDIAIDRSFSTIVTNGVINIRFVAGTTSTDPSPSVKGIQVVQTAVASTPATPSNTQAIGVSNFLNSEGIDVHMSQSGSESTYASIINYTGIRNFRDNVYSGGFSNVLQLHTDTARTGFSGALADLIIDPGNVQADGNNLLPYVSSLVASAGALLAIEGANEPNNFPITYNGQQGGGSGSWTPVALAQTSMYGQVKDGPLNGYPVWSVTQAGGQTNNVGLQFLQVPPGTGLTGVPDSTVYADFANMHNYVSTNVNQIVDNQAWFAASSATAHADFDSLHGDSLYSEFGSTYLNAYPGYNSAGLGTLPRVTTETGWDTVGNPGGQPVQAQMLTNVLIDQFKRGWAYTFIYEALDEGSTQGIYSNSTTPKTAATWIHNMNTILADTGTTPTPGVVNYSIASQPATVHDLLLQKSNGTYELIINDERAGSTTDSITVSLGSTISSVNVYDISSGTSPTTTLTNVSSVPLTLSNHAMILEFSSNVPPCSVTPTTLSNGTVGTAYSQAFSISSGCSASSTYTVGSGSLPSGLSLSTTGTLSGTPTTAGTYTFAVNYDTASQSETLVIGAASACTILPTTLPNGNVGSVYLQVFISLNCSTSSYTVTSGSLPTGLALNTNGTLTGTPTAAGTSSFTVGYSTGSRAETLIITTQPSGVVRQGQTGITASAYMQAPIFRTGSSSNTDSAGRLTLSGGSASYTFTGTYVNAPFCVASDGTAVSTVKTVATNTTLTITGTGTDSVAYICFPGN